MTDRADDMMAMAKDMLDTLNGFAEGKVHSLADGTMVTEEEAEGNGETLYEWLMDNCGCRYIVESDGEYVASIICMGCGGPGLWLDTFEEEIRGKWGADEIHVSIPRRLVTMVDEEMECECMRMMGRQ